MSPYSTNLVCRQKGIALVLTLWVLVLLGVIAGSYIRIIRTDTALTGYWLAAAKARWAAYSGVQLAVIKLIEPGNGVWIADGRVQEVDYAGIKLRIAIQDEAGKIDLNQASADLLDGILLVAGASQSERLVLVDAIQDWRDTDHHRRLNGAEDNDYLSEGYAYGSRDNAFSSVEELALIYAMKPEIFQEIESALTVFSGVSGVNPDVAGKKVLLALPGMHISQVDNYLERRKSLDSADVAFLSLGVDELLTTARGGAYSVHVEAIEPGGVKQKVAAVIKLERRRRPGRAAFSILTWKESAKLMFE